MDSCLNLNYNISKHREAFLIKHTLFNFFINEAPICIVWYIAACFSKHAC